MKVKIGDKIEFVLTQPTPFTGSGVVKKVWRKQTNGNKWVEIFVPKSSNSPAMIEIGEITSVNGVDK